MLQTLFHIPLWPFATPWLWLWSALILVVAAVQAQ